MDDEQGIPRWPLPVAAASEPFDGSFVLNDGRSLVLGETIFQWRRTSEQGTSERGTHVFRAKMGAKDVIGKCSWSANTRTSEAAIIKTATDFATDSSDFWILDHRDLPRILYEEQREFEATSRHLSKHSGEEHKPSILRIIAQEELHLIVELTKSSLTQSNWAKRFAASLKIRRYRWCLNNPIYRVTDGKIYGVLNDFDFAREPYLTWPDETSPSIHLYRFDQELMSYAMVFVSCRYKDGKQLEAPPFKDWDHLGPEELFIRKSAFFSNLVPAPTSTFAKFHIANLLLQKMFADDYNAQRVATPPLILEKHTGSDEDSASDSDLQLEEDFDSTHLRQRYPRRFRHSR
ncbi:hypothetical protein DFH08DRAFT_1084160 [Mycena albidolilacea]|uniref:Uncharacterized protein n=1 Tax=Mycena albidolilacea TaxID=1033008 RepID=A0AAD6ZMK4_9AGAR|nr:hypothetical protein DFH08DRAFT_1084160 [Mycena albidolilacea]